jgi:predicted phosphoribosyltransferase
MSVTHDIQARRRIAGNLRSAGLPPWYADRRDAGRKLAELLSDYAHRDDVVVLGLARGGMPVAYEVAIQLGGALDVLVVRKVGAPQQPELAMGAVASGGVRLINQDAVDSWGIGDAALGAAIRKAEAELARRERSYRAEWPEVDLSGRTAIVVDDGVATGGTAVAALRSVRLRGAGCVVLAVPVAPGAALQRLRAEADGVVVVDTPSPFVAVGQWYRDFDQVSDEAVVRMLNEAAAEGSRS